MRLTTSLCPFCEARAWLRPLPAPSWQPSRSAATLQKRRPSRMELSPKAGQGSASRQPGRGPLRKSRNSPFGGMNMTKPPRELQSVHGQVSAVERRRPPVTGNRRQKETKARDPMKALKMQRTLSPISYETRSRTKKVLLERDDFGSFNLLPAISESISAQALRGMTDISPTPIQRLAIPALLGLDSNKRRKSKGLTSSDARTEMRQFLLAAETGSGKTLAYALPLIEAVKRAERLEAERDAQIASTQEERMSADRLPSHNPLELDAPTVESDSAGRPRAVILVPTAELVAQVGSLFKSLSHTIKFRAAMISAAFTGSVIRSRLFSSSGVDVVITTPHLLSSVAESEPNILSRVSHLVIDEADSLLDRSFSPITSDIIDRATPSLEQLIFCSATIPRSLDSYLRKRYPDVKRLATPNLHAIPRRVQLSVVDIDKLPYQGNRNLACAQTIWDIGKEAVESNEVRQEKVVVFVNEREKAAEVATYLRSKGIDAHALSRDSDSRKQVEILDAFTAAPARLDKVQPAAAKKSEATAGTATTSVKLAEYHPLAEVAGPSKRSLSNVKVLVMTDLGSRGIDTLSVRHVLLYDVPHTSIDFIHRLGRVGRMGRRGRGIVLVGRHDRKDVVREVRDGMFKGQALI